MIDQHILLTVDALVFTKGAAGWQLLLVRRKHDPNKGMWAIPGGFVEDDEELEAAAIRELHEETGLLLSSMTQLHTFGKVGRDPRGRTVSVVYYAFTNEAHKVEGADDAAEAAWINIKDITALAFDHMEILDFALDVLKGRM
jgi:8-oxo-dGTP diphosphatase